MGASIKLSKLNNKEVECMQFSLNHIYGNVKLRDNNKEVSLKLSSMNLCLMDEFLMNNTSKVIKILSPTQIESKDPLIEFLMI